MNRKELKTLTWKYFIEQKVREVFIFVLVVALSFIVPILAANFGGDCNSLFEVEVCDTVQLWLSGFLNLFAIILSIAIVATVFILLYLAFDEWFSDNWKKAKKRATIDLLKKVKRRANNK